MIQIPIAFEHEGKKYTSATDAAKHAAVKLQTVYNWLNARKVDGVRRRHLRYVEVESLKAFIEPKTEAT